jgi:hypothetical protein
MVLAGKIRSSRKKIQSHYAGLISIPAPPCAISVGEIQAGVSSSPSNSWLSLFHSINVPYFKLVHTPPEIEAIILAVHSVFK